jgi:hypothetical protein
MGASVEIFKMGEITKARKNRGGKEGKMRMNR